MSQRVGQLRCFNVAQALRNHDLLAMRPALALADESVEVRRRQERAFGRTFRVPLENASPNEASELGVACDLGLERMNHLGERSERDRLAVQVHRALVERKI